MFASVVVRPKAKNFFDKSCHHFENCSEKIAIKACKPADLYHPFGRIPFAWDIFRKRKNTSPSSLCHAMERCFPNILIWFFQYSDLSFSLKPLLLKGSKKFNSELIVWVLTGCLPRVSTVSIDRNRLKCTGEVRKCECSIFYLIGVFAFPCRPLYLGTSLYSELI